MTKNEAAKAIRTTVNGKTIVTVTVNGETKRLGGARAARAEAVVVSAWTRPDGTGFRMEWNCRADAAAAQTEAHRLETMTEMRERGIRIPCTPAAWSIAVPVVNA